MITTLEAVIISDDEIVSAPVQQTLATGKNVLAFSVKKSPKTLGLKTADKFFYHGEQYEIMNTYQVQAKIDYIKFNCVKVETNVGALKLQS